MSDHAQATAPRLLMPRTITGWLHRTVGARPPRQGGEDIEMRPRGEAQEGPDAPPDDAAEGRRRKLQALHQAWHAGRARPVDRDEAADLFNQVRRHGTAHRAALAGVTNETLMAGITPELESRWWRAQGLAEEQVQAFKDGALYAGFINPIGGLPGLGFNYGAPPFVSAETGAPVNGFYAGLVAALVSPMASTALQPGVIELCERVRERTGHSVQIDKASINDKAWPPMLADSVSQAAARCAEQGEGIAAELRHLAGEGGIPQDQEAMDALLRRAPQETRDRLALLCRSFADTEKSLQQQQVQLLMTQGSWRRQSIGNQIQLWPRAARGVAPLLTALAIHHADPAKTLPRLATPIAQCIASLIVFAGNIVCAGLDNRNQHLYNNALNLMYGDFLNPEGHAKEDSGQRILGADIDEAKLRGFLLSPEQALVKRLEATVKSRIERLEASMEKRRRRNGAEAGQPAEEEQLLQALQADLAKLRNGEINQIDENGAVGSMLSDDSDSYVGQFLGQGVVAKYNKPGEFSSQAAQRYGQAFHMLALGSAFSSLIGKGVNAATGGTERTPLVGTIFLMLAAATFGAIGAYFQSAAVNIKNNRRDSVADGEGVTFMTQLIRGCLAMVHSLRGQQALTHANAEAIEALLALSQVDMAVEAIRKIAPAPPEEGGAPA